MNNVDGTETGLWDETDGYYYDQVINANGKRFPMKVHSLVGMLPMLAVETIQPKLLARLPNFKRRLEWFIAEPSRPAAEHRVLGGRGHRAAPASRDRRRRSNAPPLKPLLDENEFSEPARYSLGLALSSSASLRHPLPRSGVSRRLRSGRVAQRLVRRKLELARTGLVPHQLPLDRSAAELPFLLWGRISSGVSDGFRKIRVTLGSRVRALRPADRHLHASMRTDAAPFNGGVEKFQRDPLFRDLLLFYEYFNGDNAAGVGASIKPVGPGSWRN